MISFHQGEGLEMNQQFTLYLIGYGNQIPEAFFDRLEGSLPSINGDSCLIIDVRRRRRSWAWSYSGPQIEYIVKKQGHHYIWLHELGNEGNANRIRLANEPAGMMALEQQVRHSKRPVVLLCAELLSANSHRSLVARKLAERLEADGDRLEIRPL